MDLLVGKYVILKVIPLPRGHERLELGKWKPTDGGAVEKWSCGDCFSYAKPDNLYRYISVQCTDHRWLVPHVKRLLLEEMWAEQGQLIPREVEPQAEKPAPRKRPPVPRSTRRTRDDAATRRRNGLS